MKGAAHGISMRGDGKFGRAALAISLVASFLLAVMVGLAFFLILTGHRMPAVNYWIGLTILFCWLLELVAIVLGIIGLFEATPKKRYALFAIGVSAFCFLGTILPTIIGLAKPRGY